MTPAARLSAAIEILDRILAGSKAEQALTNWGRANRFAGSGDRYALRDLVFDALRCRRSFACLGGGLTGRGLILGGLRAAGRDVDALFTGLGHAPAVVDPQEAGARPDGDVALDTPDWLSARLKASLGADYGAVMRGLQKRAPVFLRVNLAQISLDAVAARLAEDGIVTRPCAMMNTALEVLENERKIQHSALYLDGLIELQDAASQAVIAALDLRPGLRVLDYCAGGGGKTLAMAAQGVTLFAHDAHPHRMKDLSARAARAKAKVEIVQNPGGTAPYDLILMDVPCSGSGSWRRDPQGKWALTEAKLNETLALQASILDQCRTLVKPAGVLAYVTCSLLRDENEAQASAFVARHVGWRVTLERRFSPLQGGDGFFVALLTQSQGTGTQP